MEQAGSTMPSPLAEPTYDLVHATVLRHFPALVRDLGGDPALLLAECGLAPQHCEEGHAVTCRQWIAVMERAAAVLDVPAFGMMLAERQGGVGVYGPLGAAMRNARSFGDSLRYVSDHSAAHSLGARVWMGRTASGSHVFVGHDILVDSGTGRTQVLEQVLLAGHLSARFLTGDKVGARRVHFRHRALSPPAAYRRRFGCEVRFCQNEDGIAFAAEAMACPIVDADAATFSRVAAEIERSFTWQRPPFHALVRGQVMQLLWTGECGNEDVGRALHLHPRTLLRRLREEGTSFQRIKDEVRRDLMLYYLRETDLELSRISEKLGFAEQSVMSRFARAMLGASPSALRGGLRGAARDSLS